SHFPADADAHIEYARTAQLRRDHSASVARWSDVRERFPQELRGHLGHVVALRESRQLEAAETQSLAALRRFPDEVALLVEHARIAAAARSWTEAHERWQLLRQRLPDLPAGYDGGMQALSSLGRHVEAEALATDARGRFPDQPGILVGSARVAQA